MTAGKGGDWPDEKNMVVTRHTSTSCGIGAVTNEQVQRTEGQGVVFPVGSGKGSISVGDTWLMAWRCRGACLGQFDLLKTGVDLEVSVNLEDGDSGEKSGCEQCWIRPTLRAVVISNCSIVSPITQARGCSPVPSLPVSVSGVALSTSGSLTPLLT